VSLDVQQRQQPSRPEIVLDTTAVGEKLLSGLDTLESKLDLWSQRRQEIWFQSSRPVFASSELSHSMM
jgi:hypothetical protein